MQKTLAFIISFIVVIAAVLGVAYFFFSQHLFLPWNQQADYTFLEEPIAVKTEESFELDPTVQGGFDEQITVQEVDVPFSDIEHNQGGDAGGQPLETVVQVYYSQLSKPRMMTLDPYGNIVVSDIKASAVYAIIDTDGDYVADEKKLIIGNLNNPHGVAFHGTDLYIAETDKVRVLRNVHEGYGFDRNEVIITNLTDNSGHFTRTLKIINDQLYVTVGSSCNVCVERNENRAALLRFNLDGSNKEVIATGLRNTVDFEQSPFDQALYGVDNGRDWLGDQLPPEELNRIEIGAHYGWPYCYGNQVRDESFEGNFDCTQTKAPLWEMGAHVAPLGLAFYNGSMFPEFFGDVLIAQHGSWNSTVPVGYKVVRVDMDEHQQPRGQEDLLDIFLRGDSVRGRPVDVMVGKNGEIYVTDDFAGRIYVMVKK